MAWIVRRTSNSLHLESSIRQLSSQARSGFAGIPGLIEPKNWSEYAGNALSKCQGIVNSIATTPPSIETIRLLDNLSDTLCQVLDAAEFCRNVHADPEWRAAAERVCVELGSYVHDLNTNYALYTALTAALPKDEHQTCNSRSLQNEKGGGAAGHGKTSDVYDEETLLVGRMLQRDFERYGVHLSGSRRDQMASLVAKTQTLGFAFTQNCIDPEKYGKLVLTGDTVKAVQHLPHHLQKQFRPWRANSSRRLTSEGAISGLVAPGASAVLHNLYGQADIEGIRKEAYYVYNTFPMDNLRIIDELVAARHEMASLMGYASYAAYQLDDFSLAHSPETVSTFLKKLSEAVMPAAREEAAQLAEIKRKYQTKGSLASAKGNGEEERLGVLGGLNQWDLVWALRMAGSHSSHQQVADLKPYLTLDGCVAGLSALLESLLGVRLQDEAPAPGELWAPHVRKLVAEDAEDGRFLGTVYLDLYERAGKFPGAAHFSLRCGKELLESGSGSESYQSPVVALVANFRETEGEHLTHGQLETLFHEFGHSIHSLLSRTKYQHLSGTRGPQDLIEIPSHVFERFASDPAALTLVAQNSVGSIPPQHLLTAPHASKREFPALTLQSILVMCAIDQLVHGEAPPMGSDAEGSIAAIVNEYSAIGAAPGAHPHIRFNHMVTYGANYYCYLYAQCLSAAVWGKGRGGSGEGGGAVVGEAGRDGRALLLKNCPSPEWPSGDTLRHQLLEPGGAKVSHHYVKDLLGRDGEGMVVGGGDAGWYPTPDALLRYLGLSKG